MHHAQKNVRPITTSEYIITNHTIFSICQQLMNHCKFEFQSFKQNSTLQLIMTNYSKAIIQAALL